MTDYIVRHAIQNMWCSPEQDYQHIFKPARISHPRGVRRHVRIEWEDVQLPNATDTFHIYQIGQLSPKYLNLAPKEKVWYKASWACTERNLLVDFYFNNGRQLPRFDIYFQKTRTRNLVIAVREQRRIGDLVEEPIYARFYTNAYFASDRSQESEDGILIEGKYPEDQRDVVLFQRRIRDLREKKGYVYIFHNGFLVEDTHPSIVEPGDVIELVHDTSIKEVLDYKVSDLETFTSKKDGVKKYLISRLKKTTETIDYQDDVDLFLVKERDEHLGRTEGVYLHKNNPMTHRMITHKDYSVPVKTVVGFANEYEHWQDPLALTLRLHIRHSGYERDLVYEHSRIKELYRLDDEQIVRAMLGANSTVDVWRADSLEDSAYTKAMGVHYEELTKELVQNAYGYNAISKIIADTPQWVKTHEQDGTLEGVHLTPALRYRSTFYEYDENGKLLESHFHQEGEFYKPYNDDCVLVEGIIGYGSEELDTVYGEREQTLEPHVSYRFYVCDAISGIPSYEWREAKQGEHYELIDGKVHWLIDYDTHYSAVRSDKQFLSYRLPLAPNNGILRFSVTGREYEDGSWSTNPLSLPIGRFDLYLNGHALIEGVDYTVNWPEVVVNNKRYLRRDDFVQELFIRGVGFVESDMARLKPDEVGFVTHGLLSRNDRFDVRNDKVMRFTVGGGIHHRSELKFSEEDHGYRMESVPNGTPYAIEDVIVPMREFTIEDTYTLRERSLEVDRQISDYLTKYWPEKPIAYPSIIKKRYPILSPFTARLHYDLLNGYLYPEEIKGQYGDSTLKKLLVDYEWLLDFDPIILGYDKEHIAIHPHDHESVTELDIYQYTFLKRAVDLYLNGEVDLTSFVKVKEGWI